MDDKGQDMAGGGYKRFDWFIDRDHVQNDQLRRRVNAEAVAKTASEAEQQKELARKREIDDRWKFIRADYEDALQEKWR